MELFTYQHVITHRATGIQSFNSVPPLIHLSNGAMLSLCLNLLKAEDGHQLCPHSYVHFKDVVSDSDSNHCGADNA